MKKLKIYGLMVVMLILVACNSKNNAAIVCERDNKDETMEIFTDQDVITKVAVTSVEDCNSDGYFDEKVTENGLNSVREYIQRTKGHSMTFTIKDK